MVINSNFKVLAFQIDILKITLEEPEMHAFYVGRLGLTSSTL